MDIKQFLMLRMIGQGAYGQVFLAKRKSNEKVYAIKMLKKKLGDKKKQIEHVMAEKDVLAEAKHPFIVSLSFTFESSKHYYFALEFCPGGDLYNLLHKRQFLKEDQAQFYAALIVIALEHLHSRNIIYRDLKPENILLDMHGYIRLTDFGLSVIQSNEEMQLSIAGTPEYLSPEVLSQQGHDKSVDCWSLGCVLYEMVCGQLPFRHEDKKILLQSIKFDEPNYPDKLSPELRSLLQALLQKDPSQRISLAGVRGHPWFKIDDWSVLYDKKKVAPFIPVIQHEADYSNFDSDFTEQDMNGSPNSSNSNFSRLPNFAINNSL